MLRGVFVILHTDSTTQGGSNLAWTGFLEWHEIVSTCTVYVVRGVHQCLQAQCVVREEYHMYSINMVT